MGIQITTGQRQAHVPEGEYRACVVEIKETTYVGKRRVLELQFEIADGPCSGTIVRGFANAHYETYSEHTKLRQWLSMVMTHDLDPGEKLDLDIFKKKILSVRVKSKKSKKTGNDFSNVTDILGLVSEVG